MPPCTAVSPVSQAVSEMLENAGDRLDGLAESAGSSVMPTVANVAEQAEAATPLVAVAVMALTQPKKRLEKLTELIGIKRTLTLVCAIDRNDDAEQLRERAQTLQKALEGAREVLARPRWRTVGELR